ncbi:hypothetical protein [Clostridium tarantellae]|uniref:Uncharacterized protein n=1 Tax=Clostridium tarantellae TaxID=39493 RepID=A0A6I1MTV4_9CLOT|nr:hypothetical protein [Clostridium tarantellae]MPQ43659.1 hypothetical protein [Clostridium tarantellae]
MKYLKSILSFILSFLLMFSLVLTSLIMFVKFIVLNKEVYVDIIEKNNISSKIHKSLKDNLEYKMISENLPVELVKELIKEEEIKEDFLLEITEIVSYFSTGINNIKPISVEKYESRLNKNVENYINKNTINISEKDKKILENIIKESSKIISNKIELIESNLLSQSLKISKLSKILIFLVSRLYIISIIISIIIILILVLLWNKKIINSMQWISYGFFTSGLFMGSVFLFGKQTKFYENIIISNDYLKELIIALMNIYLLKISYIATTLIIIGVALIIPKLIKDFKNSKVLINKNNS